MRNSNYNSALTLAVLISSIFAANLATADSNRIVLYDGWGHSEHYEIEGRVIEAERASSASANDSWLRNLWRNVRTMKNSEQGNVEIALTASGQTLRTHSNEEGYFQIKMTSKTPSPSEAVGGWRSINAEETSGNRAKSTGRILIVPKTNTTGIISDVDDTVIVSEVIDKSKLLQNTFLQNPTQRKTFPGTAAFYKKLLALNAEVNAAPMFYLSASPRQLAGNINAFLTHNDYPKGALITKQINGDERDPLIDQQTYKISKIEKIFASLPWVRFTLIGDDGEHDPEIYSAIQKKYPDRVSAIYIRKVHTDPARVTHSGQQDLAAAILR
jgi:phosphatidate phosphatase APP1